MQKRLTFFRAVCYPQWVLAYYLYHLKLQVGFQRKVLGEELNEYQWMAVHYNALQEGGRFTTNLSYIVKYYPETNKQTKRNPQSDLHILWICFTYCSYFRFVSVVNTPNKK